MGNVKNALMIVNAHQINFVIVISVLLYVLQINNVLINNKDNIVSKKSVEIPIVNPLMIV